MTAIDLGLPTPGAPPVPHGLAGVPVSEVPLSAKEYRSDQEVRWCPGCGDYAVLAAVQSFLPDLGLRKENIVFISGIGCSSRFPYYLDTYGMHSVHGRAPAIATGLAVTRPDLSVWVVTGDGDALSIGGNHLVHALRRNVNLKILLFNNRIYGLTKGQYSPTSEPGKVTKSTPQGSVDHPFNPVSLALGAEATFVARALDSDRRGLTDVLRAAAEHRGTALVEIYQNCPVFNDGAFTHLKEPGEREQHILDLRDGEPVRFGTDGRYGVVRDPLTGRLRVATVAETGEDALLVHDVAADDPTQAFALSRLTTPTEGTVPVPVPVGVFRAVRREAYDDLVREQVTAARTGRASDLRSLLHGKDTWTVPASGGQPA
ncbi:2-oxoacid:ferredoxin oxidoreductase subunit beta [Streptomyces sp. NBC_00988]|uniref:2-oxoacid:ferredoxin oxidoreductase subunit beta n=1 Tax=Streptomyces sp. NBC_00988 TaxID=2903704 RepID=UPI003862E538|nr:2-oxoacid:ferredoxin oxidoreductase subunit beta [Streptomyces sp. NBC_00988]